MPGTDGRWSGQVVTDTVPLRIAQISDLHCGTPTFQPDLLDDAIGTINRMRPDLVAVIGDLTAEGTAPQFEEAARWLERVEPPTFVVQGNHDARNLGWMHFERLFGERYRALRIAFPEERAERLRASGVTVLGVDSSVPDLNEGRVGREHYDWIAEQFSRPDDLRVLVIHHHLVSVPGTGRERNTITDAGDVLELVTRLGTDLVLCGHKHVPFFWGVNGTLICSSGTVSTRRLRGLTPPSWHEIVVDARTIRVFTHYEGGRRQLSSIRTRGDRAGIRESLVVTDALRTVRP